jgi:hypothetical protein
MCTTRNFAGCLGVNVWMLKSDDTRRGVDDVHEAYGIPPEDFPMWQALVGDTADNIPGVKGCGPKTATKLMQEYGSLDGIVRAAHAGEIRGVMGERIEAAADPWDGETFGGTLALSLALVTLRTDALTDDECAAVLEERKIHTETAADFEEDIMPPDIAEQLAAAETEPPEAAPSQPEPSAPQAAMVVHDNGGPTSLQPRNLADLRMLAKWVVDSRMFSQFGTPQAVALVMLKGNELGLGVMASLDRIHIVEGKPTLSAQLIKGMCQSSPSCEYFMLVEASNEAATFETKRRGEPQPARMTYSMKEAELAGLTRKTNWRNQPRAMLCNRCIAELGRMVYPDVVANIYTPDELGADIPEEVAA